ncbi:MAG: hypothetical protein H3C68_04920 [Deltaproteobacteria bacterium]|nr:hypothetical protein [Deltaproteobacteria bacterium]MBZ0220069.1 hypothetical protein [Deltaproteobacteria bacterium]
MKRFTLRKALLTAAVFTAAVCTGSIVSATDFTTDFQAGTAANGIGKSRHNMGALGGPIATRQTTEICVFCHTPHHANVDGFAAGEKAPLWNRTNAAAAETFTPYGTTAAGTSIGQPGGASLACLSCHDGVTTFDNLVNAPGKGLGTNKAAWGFGMGVFDQGNFRGESTDRNNLGCTYGCHGNTTNEYAAVAKSQIGRLNISTDLSNDHPVSVVYYGADHVDGGRASLRATTTDIASIDLYSDVWSTTNAAVQAGGNLRQNKWAVGGFVSDTATIGDLLRNDKVECVSCHDPHFKNTSWDEVKSTYLEGYEGTQNSWSNWCGNSGETCTDGMFLRRVGGNTGSGVCKTCHEK